MGVRVAGCLQVSGCSGVFGVCSGAAEKLSDLRYASLITLSILDFADLKPNRASLPSMRISRGGTLTIAMRLCTGLAWYAPKTVMR
jgi:hypothetical protein